MRWKTVFSDGDIEELADELNVTKEYLLTQKDYNEYVESKVIMDAHGEFKNEEELEKILDIIDLYCDLVQLDDRKEGRKNDY